MVTNARDPQAVNGRLVSVVHLNGLSTDTKPTDVANGSDFYEIDTATKFWFDAEGGQWIDPTAPAESDEDEGGDGE